jgi:DUF4097 and DUF4098 domain-containing protein YvlB
MIEKTFPLTGPISLVVRIGHGEVVVTTHDALDQAVVRLTPRDKHSDVAERTTVELRGGALAVVTPNRGGLTDLLGGWKRDRDALDVAVDVPTGTDLKITTASAPIQVVGRSGDADLFTGSADITADDIAGDLRVRSGSSHARIGAVTGSVVARSGSGSVILGAVGGSVQAGFGSGDLTVESCRGTVRSRAGSGDAHIGAAWGDIDFVAGSGQVSVGLPSGVSARLDVTSGSGRVSSELPIEDSPVSGGTTITVRARTGSGDIRLFRAGDAGQAA